VQKVCNDVCAITLCRYWSTKRFAYKGHCAYETLTVTDREVLIRFWRSNAGFIIPGYGYIGMASSLVKNWCTVTICCGSNEAFVERDRRKTIHLCGIDRWRRDYNIDKTEKARKLLRLFSAVGKKQAAYCTACWQSHDGVLSGETLLAEAKINVTKILSSTQKRDPWLTKYAKEKPLIGHSRKQDIL